MLIMVIMENRELLLSGARWIRNERRLRGFGKLISFALEYCDEYASWLSLIDFHATIAIHFICQFFCYSRYYRYYRHYRYSHKYFRFSLFCILHVSSSDNFLESQMLLAISFFTEDLLFYVRNKLTIVIWRESEWWWAHSYPAFGPFGIYKRLFIKNVYLF